MFRARNRMNLHICLKNSYTKHTFEYESDEFTCKMWFGIFLHVWNIFNYNAYFSYFRDIYIASVYRSVGHPVDTIDLRARSHVTAIARVLRGIELIIITYSLLRWRRFKSSTPVVLNGRSVLEKYFSFVVFKPRNDGRSAIFILKITHILFS